MESNDYSAPRLLANTDDGGFRPIAVASRLNILLINLVNLLVLGLIILA
jgi:hypothetical protein